MTEAEALEMIAIYIANAIESFSLYFAFLAAYMVTAYVVGSNLSRFQAVAVSGIYCVAAITISLSLIVSIQAWIAVKESTPTVLDEVLLYSPMLWLALMPVILISGISVSLYFMWQVRHPESA
jgi:hypothetical protein